MVPNFNFNIYLSIILFYDTQKKLKSLLSQAKATPINF